MFPVISILMLNLVIKQNTNYCLWRVRERERERDQERESENKRERESENKRERGREFVILDLVLIFTLRLPLGECVIRLAYLQIDEKSKSRAHFSASIVKSKYRTPISQNYLFH